MKFQLTALCLLALGAAVPASAQTVRPGLWEINNKMAGASDPRMQEMRKAQLANMAAMRKQVDSMPPEQRKQMQAMMAKLGQASQMTEDGGMTMKMCVTPEMAAQQKLTTQQREGCTNTRSPAVGGVIKISYSCVKPASHGEGTVTLSGDTGYTMNMTMHVTEGGRNTTTSMATSGKWLAASCGDVKPPAMHMPATRPPAPK
jgi:hypothetical protein